MASLPPAMADTKQQQLTTVNNLPDLSHLSSTAETEVEVDQYSHLTLWEALKKWRRVVYYSLAISSSIIMLGYDYVIVGNSSAMPAFQHDFGELYNHHWIIPSLWLSLWTFISPGGMMIGSLFAGYFQDRSGRRSSFFLSSVLVMIGVAVCFASQYPGSITHRRGTFLAGKGVQGLGLGMIITTCQTYMSETVPPKLRGPLLAFFPIFTLAGQLIGSLVIYGLVSSPNGYAIAFATQWIFSALTFVAALIIPESPVHLVRAGRIDDARVAQRRLAGRDIDPDHTVAAIVRDIEHERRQTAATFAACFAPSQRLRTGINLFTSVLPQFFGLGLLAQASYFGQVVGISANLSLVLLIVGVVVGLLANFASMLTVNRFGHRSLTIFGMAACSVLWLSMGIAGSVGAGTNAGAAYSSAVLVSVTAAAGLTVWPASYAITSEVSALHLRARSQGISWLFSSAFTAGFGLSLPYMYNPDAGNLRGMIGYVYASLCLGGLVFVWFWVPEMKGRTPSEISRMFELKLRPRDFVNWRHNADAEKLRQDRSAA